MDTTKIGEKIRQYRKLKGITQEELANLTQLSTMSIRRYESGERIPPKETLLSIASVLDISLQDIIDLSSQPSATSNTNEEHLLEKSISSFECFISYLNSIGFNVQFGTSADGEQSSVTLSKGNETVGYTMEEFRKFQSEINDSVEYQVWKKQKGGD